MCGSGCVTLAGGWGCHVLTCPPANAGAFPAQLLQSDLANCWATHEERTPYLSRCVRRCDNKHS